MRLQATGAGTCGPPVVVVDPHPRCDLRRDAVHGFYAQAWQWVRNGVLTS